MKENKMDEGTIVQQPELTEQQKANEFIKEYEALCNRYGFNIVVNPAFKARDDGTWSVVLQSGVGKLPKKE